jgi:hypothetical protein
MEHVTHGQQLGDTAGRDDPEPLFRLHAAGRAKAHLGMAVVLGHRCGTTNPKETHMSTSLCITIHTAATELPFRRRRPNILVCTQMAVVDTLVIGNPSKLKEYPVHLLLQFFTPQSITCPDASPQTCTKDRHTLTDLV